VYVIISVDAKVFTVHRKSQKTLKSGEYRDIEKKKIRVGADQTFQLAIREISIMSVLKVRLVILKMLKS
jgi:hypothetical protein